MSSRSPIQRRSFLGIALGAPFAARETAQQAAVASQAAATGVSVAPRSAERVYTGFGSSRGRNKFSEKLLEFIRGGQPPMWQRAQWMQQARRAANRLEPNVACLRSVSLAAKFQMQIARNYEYEQREYTEQVEAAEDMFKFRTLVSGKPPPVYDDDDDGAW